MSALLFERKAEAEARWQECHKGAARLVELANDHYTRQTPGSNQCCRPGMNYTLLLSDGMAGWIVWRPRPDVGRMDGLEAWECTLFRNVGLRLSSELVREATDATFCEWGWPPRDGLISAIGVEQTRARRSKKSPPGKCFLEAGWLPFAHPNPSPEKQGLIAPHPLKTPRLLASESERSAQRDPQKPSERG